MSAAWRDRRFMSLRTSALTVYSRDLRRQSAAKSFIAAQKKAIERDEHPESEDPFMRLETGLRNDYPEIWSAVGERVLGELRRGQQ